MQRPSFIPRPLVRTNQWVIVLSVVVTWITGWYGFLLIPLGSGVLGLFFKFNPVMVIAKQFLRKPPSSYVPEDVAQQQFNQWIAVTCLLLGFAAYTLHFAILAYIFTAMVAIAAFVAILGFCVGCFIRFQWSQFRHRQRAKRLAN